MSHRKPTAYPDISDMLARKAEGRREIAGRSFGEKIAMVEKLRERLAPLKRAREQRREAERTGWSRQMMLLKRADMADGLKFDRDQGRSDLLPFGGCLISRRFDAFRMPSRVQHP